MGKHTQSNDTYYIGEYPERPRPDTPRNMLDYANAVIALWEMRLEKNNLSQSMKFYCLNQIKLCKQVKVQALEFMTEGYKPDDIVKPR